MSRASLFLGGALLAPLLAACAVQEQPYARPYAGQGPTSILPGVAGTAPTSLSAAVPPGHAVGILAPLTGPNAERGAALVKAAQLALGEPGAPPLDVRDTGGTAQGAAQAAQAAIAGGDGLIIGPLTAPETAAAAGPAQAAGVPVLAFTSDPAQARPGVWTLGLTPAQQVRRLVGAAQADGKSNFAAVLPRNDFGQAMGAALTQAVPGAAVHFHDASNAAIADTMRDISGFADRRGPLQAQMDAARARHDDQALADLKQQPVPPPPFDALLLADAGGRLAWLSTFIPFYDLGAPAVRILGPALWADPRARGPGSELDGAWFAAPDPAARASFDAAYSAKYGAPAPGLADFAYDAASIARVMAQSGGFSQQSLCRPDGFAGVDGVLALAPDGSVRRGLALFEIQHGSASIIQPTPASLSAPGI